MSYTVFQNARIFDGSGREPFAGDVKVEGNRITAVGDVSGPPSDGAQVIDVAGATLMPGLVEAHAHLSWPSAFDRIITDMNLPPEENLLIAARNARILLDHGFTSAYSAGALGARFDIAIRNEIDGGWLPGPRLKASTIERTPVDAWSISDLGLPSLHDGGHADDLASMRAAVRKAKDMGVDSLKFMLSGDDSVAAGSSQQIMYTDEQVAAVGDEARACGLWLACHAHASEAVKMGARNGFRVFYHCTDADEEALDMLEARKDEIFVAPAAGFIAEAVRVGFGAQRTLDRMLAVVPEMIKRGIRILPGGDYGFIFNANGHNARDLAVFVDLFGFTATEALVSATKLGGEIMGMADELGMVKPGYLADLLVVQGDPTRDVSILQNPDNITTIMKDGAFHKHVATA